MLQVIERIALAWVDLRPLTIQRSWQKLIPTEAPIDENAVPTIEEFVGQFTALRIDITPSDVDAWFQADGPGYEHMDEQGIIDLVTANLSDGKYDDEDAVDIVVQQKCPVSHSEAARMLEACLIACSSPSSSA